MLNIKYYNLYFKRLIKLAKSTLKFKLITNIIKELSIIRYKKGFNR